MAEKTKEPTSPRLEKLKKQLKDYAVQQEQWARQENLAQTNVDRISGAMSLLEEQIEEELAEITPKSENPEGKPLHDGEK